MAANERPEIFVSLEEVDDFRAVHRFAEECIGAEIVGSGNIPDAAGVAQSDEQSVGVLWLAAFPAENIKPIDAWHVEIEEHDFRLGKNLPIIEWRLAFQERDGVLPTSRDEDWVFDSAGFESPEQKEDIRL